MPLEHIERADISESELEDIMLKYNLMVEFLHDCVSRSCCNVCECFSCDAKTVLHKIGEK